MKLLEHEVVGLHAPLGLGVGREDAGSDAKGLRLEQVLRTATGGATGALLRGQRAVFEARLETDVVCYSALITRSAPEVASRALTLGRPKRLWAERGLDSGEGSAFKDVDGVSRASRMQSQGVFGASS